MDQILQENKEQLSFNIRDFWAYSQIADEYIKHGQPPLALKNYLDTVNKFPVVLPEPPNEEIVRRIQNSKTDMIDRRNMHDKKIMLHQELKAVIHRTNAHNDNEQTVAVARDQKHREVPESTHIDAVDKPPTESHVSQKMTKQYRDKTQEIRKSDPGYMAPTESSMAKEREKYTPFSTTPKPP